MRYLLDTDHMSLVQRRAGADSLTLTARLAAADPGDVGLCVVSFHEQSRGAHTYVSRAKTEADVVHGYRLFERLLADYSTMDVLPFGPAEAAVHTGLVLRRIRIGTLDLRIAAIALANNLIVLTRNARDFGQVPGLRIEDWTI